MPLGIARVGKLDGLGGGDVVDAELPKNLRRNIISLRHLFNLHLWNRIHWHLLVFKLPTFFFNAFTAFDVREDLHLLVLLSLFFL